MAAVEGGAGRPIGRRPSTVVALAGSSIASVVAAFAVEFGADIFDLPKRPATVVALALVLVATLLSGGAFQLQLLTPQLADPGTRTVAGRRAESLLGLYPIGAQLTLFGVILTAILVTLADSVPAVVLSTAVLAVVAAVCLRRTRRLRRIALVLGRSAAAGPHISEISRRLRRGDLAVRRAVDTVARKLEEVDPHRKITAGSLPPAAPTMSDNRRLPAMFSRLERETDIVVRRLEADLRPPAQNLYLVSAGYPTWPQRAAAELDEARQESQRLDTAGSLATYLDLNQRWADAGMPCADLDWAAAEADMAAVEQEVVSAAEAWSAEFVGTLQQQGLD